MIWKWIFVLVNIAILCVPWLMFYFGLLKKRDCRFKNIIKTSNSFHTNISWQHFCGGCQ